MAERKDSDQQELEIQQNPLAIFHFPDRPITVEEITHLPFKPEETEYIFNLQNHAIGGISVSMLNRIITEPQFPPPISKDPEFLDLKEKGLDWLDPEYWEYFEKRKEQKRTYFKQINDPNLILERVRPVINAPLLGEWAWQMIENESSLLVPGELKPTSNLRGNIGVGGFIYYDFLHTKTYTIDGIYYD